MVHILFAHSKEKLEEIFSQFGPISSVYVPMSLNHLCPKPKGMAFVRYLQEEDAREAERVMHNQRLGAGRRVQISMARQQTYYAQDESGPCAAIK